MNDNSPHTASAKKKISFKLVFSIIILGCFVGIFLRVLTHKPDKIAENLSKEIPQFKLPDLLNKEAFITNDDIKNNAPIMVNIWASWCAPCRNEHKFITKLATEYGIKIIGLNYKDKPENGQNFLTIHGNPYLKVANDADGLATLSWGLRGVPETFIVNKAGIITYRHTGEIRESDIETLLTKFKESSEILPNTIN